LGEFWVWSLVGSRQARTDGLLGAWNLVLSACRLDILIRRTGAKERRDRTDEGFRNGAVCLSPGRGIRKLLHSLCPDV